MQLKLLYIFPNDVFEKIRQGYLKTDYLINLQRKRRALKRRIEAAYKGHDTRKEKRLIKKQNSNK